MSLLQLHYVLRSRHVSHAAHSEVLIEWRLEVAVRSYQWHNQPEDKTFAMDAFMELV
jgi:hypothetical protein